MCPSYFIELVFPKKNYVGDKLGSWHSSVSLQESLFGYKRTNSILVTNQVSHLTSNLKCTCLLLYWMSTLLCQVQCGDIIKARAQEISNEQQTFNSRWHMFYTGWEKINRNKINKIPPVFPSISQNEEC